MSLLDFFQWLVALNPIFLILALVTNGRTRVFFAKIWGIVFLLGIAAIILLVKSGQLS